MQKSNFLPKTLPLPWKLTEWPLWIVWQVAVKILEKEKINDQKDVERITREIKILKKVRHPNVIQLYEVKPVYVCVTFPCRSSKLRRNSSW